MVNILEPGKIEKYPPVNPPPPKFKRKKCKAHLVCAWAFFPLAAWNFSSQKNLSPFLAWPLPLTSLTFFYWIWLAPAKKIETMKPHKNWKFYGQMECLPLWPTDKSEKGRTLNKTYEIKARCDWEHPWGTHWGPVGTKKKWKNSSSFSAPPSPLKLKRKPMKNTLGTYWNKGKETWSFCL